MPTKMKDDPCWLNVNEVMQEGAGKTMQKLLEIDELKEEITVYLNRINAIENIKSIDLHIEEVSGVDKTVDVVVDIFNRVNSGGTKLSNGDLTLAKICAQWPEARNEMKTRLIKWEKAGYKFKLDWLLRCINAVTTGEALFSAMRDVTPEQFKDGLEQTEKVIDQILNLIANRLGLDHDRVLGSRFAIPLMCRYVVQRGGKLKSQAERDRLLFWYVHTLLWGRYSASTESVLNKDLEAIESASPASEAEALDNLMSNLRDNRGDLRLNKSDFSGSSRGNRFYPLLYMMTRACHARDWGTGDELTNHLLGHLARLEIHHFFPKALLYEQGYRKREVNAIANFTFLTQETNLEVSKRDPSEYVPHYEQRTPGAIETHWISPDPNLLKLENYPEFLADRRERLATAANEFLEKLVGGNVPESVDLESTDFVQQAVEYVPGSIDDDEEEALLERCNQWCAKHGLPEGELSYELVNGETGAQLAFLDLAWPEGLQPGLTEPVCVLINESEDVEDAANLAGYRCFSSPKAFRKYVQVEILTDIPAEELVEV